MPKNKVLSDQEKGQITAYKQQKWLNRRIAKQIGRSPTCVRNFIKESENPTPKRKRGPKEKLSERDKTAILREIRKNTTSIRKIRD